jgi:hypothetical protein
MRGYGMKNGVMAVLLILVFAAPGQAQWNLSVEKNEYIYKTQAFATSPHAEPTREMPPPYTGTVAWIGFGCDGKEEWAFIGFNSAPNPKNTKIKDGYNEIEAKVKWDNTVIPTTLIQEWGSKYIQFLNDEAIIDNLIGSNGVSIEFEWYTAGNVNFPFSLTGSSKTIYSARKVCSQ